MKEMEREAFLKMPAGTVFSVVDASGTAGLYRKGRTLPIESGREAAPGDAAGFMVRSLKAERLPPGAFRMMQEEMGVNWGKYGGFVFLVYEADDVAQVIEGLMEAI